ncbi:MAG: response regulator [Polyangiaceae bacterium]|nr:response regulator [Polyangiaceae bacterium]MCB9606608.1 response regulator [Polyangiaceae bacterium]
MPKLANDNAIVMVDDNDGDLFLAETCYSRSQLRAPWLAFRSGRAFIDHLGQVKLGQEAMPALVLLDINMPEMSGIEVLEQLRQDPFFNDLPIVCMLTSSNDPRDKARASKAGARAFFTKPSTTADYVALFDSFAPGDPEALGA